MAAGSVHHRGWVPHTNVAIATAVRIYATDAYSNEVQQVGLIQNFNVNQRRTLQRLRGVCYGDRIAEILPGNTDYTISCSRAALYTKNILEVFGFPVGSNQGGNLGLVRSLADCKVPFDIQEVIWYHNAIPENNAGGFGQSNSLANLRKSNPQQQYSQASRTASSIGELGLGAAEQLAKQSGQNNRPSLPPATVTWYRDCWIENWDRTVEINNIIIMENVSIFSTWHDDGLEHWYQAT